ncbi:MAG: rhodanese-like domain-containing protein [Candidatus Paceibacterota bacterium]
MENFDTITHEDLKAKFDGDEDFVLIDVLAPMSYQRAHLPGAINIDVHEDDFVEKVEAEIADKSQEIIVYCASFECGASPTAAGKLADAGYENVIDYEGGLKDWAENGHDLEGEDAETVQKSLASA